MLGLNLRQEFKGKRLKGTAIELSNEANTGATQVSAQEFLEITYPTHDLLKGIEAVGPNQGRPVVILGERGLGKSHLMAALFHAVNDPVSTEAWLKSWSSTLNDPQIGAIRLRTGMLVIGESLHRQRYKFLWDLLFERHPHGAYIKGKWEGMAAAKTDIPSDQLILELLRHSPTMLLLDEFQTWFDGLTNTKQYPWKNWAFNFIQILSEIAKEHPDLLVLAVSVRNGAQRRVPADPPRESGPNRFQGGRKPGANPTRPAANAAASVVREPTANRSDRSRSGPDLRAAVAGAVQTATPRRSPAASALARPRARRAGGNIRKRARRSELRSLTDAQETRDLIRILANLFKSRGETTPIMTAADFRLDDEQSGIGALLDSVANQQHRALREKALRNLTAVTEAVPDHAATAPHLPEIVGALWLRSIAVANLAGAEPPVLQVDITQDKPIDEERLPGRAGNHRRQ